MSSGMAIAEARRSKTAMVIIKLLADLRFESEPYIYSTRMFPIIPNSMTTTRNDITSL
jgi:hypothetical protein